MLAFAAAKLLGLKDTVEHPILLVEDGRVREILNKQNDRPTSGLPVSDFGDAWIAPGYFDLHIHGAAGYDVMDDKPEALPAIEHLLARHGVTSYFPTTVTAAMDTTLRALERLGAAVENREPNVGVGHHGRSAKADGARAVPLGIHLEGPFISHARCGVHPPEALLGPTLPVFERFWQASRGHIRMITIAPELEGAPEVIAEASRRGICVSLGHSDADFAAAERGIAAGACHATHTFNAMRPLDHRSPGILGAVLTDDRMTADVIADGVHLAPAIVKLFAEAKGPERAVLITDAISATGMPNGRYHLGSFEVDVKDGRCTLNGRLAGSVLTMDQAVRNLARFAEWDLPSAIAAASRNPARVANLEKKGSLAIGADADFVVLNHDGEVLRTFVGGMECSR